MEILLISIITITLFLLVLSTIFRVRPCGKSFIEKWPAIDDEEFLRRCPPGTRRSTAIRVRKVISEQLGIPYEHIYPEQTFNGDLDYC